MTTVRLPFRAGTFYRAEADRLREDAQACFVDVEPAANLPRPRYGGIVPHAGWTYSGATAARTLAALAEVEQDVTFVLFGSDHTGTAEMGELYAAGAWRTPLGDVAIDESLAAALLAAGGPVRTNPDAHAYEHSIEVQVPLIQVRCPSARILPLTVPPVSLAAEVGQAVAKAVADSQRQVVLVGSTDLTHHGGHFPSPGGSGQRGVAYSRENDRRLLERMEKLDEQGVLAEAADHRNACGAGAIAATITACKTLGATRAICLEHTNCYDIIHDAQPYSLEDTYVGYASVVFV